MTAVPTSSTEYYQGPGEPAWISYNVWPWVLKAVLAARNAARAAPVQYLAAVLYATATAGLAITLVLVALVVTVPDDGPAAEAALENLVLIACAAPAVWMIPATGYALLRRRSGVPAVLQVLRAVGAPVREATKAWDRLFRSVDRILSGPVRWLLSRPRRLAVLLVLATPAALAFSAGIVAPEQIQSLAMDLLGELEKRGLLAFLILTVILSIAAGFAYGTLVFYVWLRSFLAALPMVVLYFLSTSPVLSFLAPATQLVAFMPERLATAMDSPPETTAGYWFIVFARVFVGVPGLPTTLGMVLTGVLLGWLPHLIEQAGRPSPRERVAAGSWGQVVSGALMEDGFQAVKSAAWGSGMVLVVSAALPLILFFTGDLNAATSWMAVLPLCLGAAALFFIIRKAVIEGDWRGDAAYRFAVADQVGRPAPELDAPDEFWSSAWEEAFSPLSRLVSESERQKALSATSR